MTTTTDLRLTIELKDSHTPNQKYASIKAPFGITIFSKLVYDNEHSSAERNILLLFSSRLKNLLEDEDE